MYMNGTFVALLSFIITLITVPVAFNQQLQSLPASMGQLLTVFLKTEDVQRPSLFDMPDPVLNRILQYVYGSEGSASLRCRLVSQSFNDLMLMNIRLNLNYKATLEPNRCQLSLSTRRTIRPVYSTDQIINCRLFERVFSMNVSKEDSGGWDQQDLIRLASRLSRPVDVRLYTFCSLPMWPLTATPQMRVVEVENVSLSRQTDRQTNLSPPELDFMASLNVQHLHRLIMSRRDLLQLSQRVGQLQVSELVINWDRQQSQVSSFDIELSQTFRHLRKLKVFNVTDNFSFRGVSLPHLVKFFIITSSKEADNHSRLLTSIHSAMPQLKVLNYSILPKCNSNVVNLVSTVYEDCPPTVEHLDVYIAHSQWTKVFLLGLTRPQWEYYWETIFTAILDSNKITRVSFENSVRPTWYDVEAKPFEYEESSSGAQVGLPETPSWHFHKYKLKKRNGQICTLDITCGY